MRSTQKPNSSWFNLRCFKVELARPKRRHDPAINEKIGPGNKTGLRTKQEGHSVSNIAGGSESAHRRAPGHRAHNVANGR